MSFRTILPRVSSLVVVGSLVLACGGAPSDGAAAPTAPTAAPATSASATSAGTCGKVGGQCMPETATVACKSQPAAACGAGEICCVM